MEQGLPRVFIFLLVNKGESEVRLPVPAIGCNGCDQYDGDISIELHFTPRGPSQGGTGHGCGGGVFDVSLAQRIRGWQRVGAGATLAIQTDAEKVVWKILHPGETIAHSADAGHTLNGRPYLYDDRDQGTYEYWAVCTPPTLRSSDLDVLEKMPILFSRAVLETNHLTFRNQGDNKARSAYECWRSRLPSSAMRWSISWRAWE